MLEPLRPSVCVSVYLPKHPLFCSCVLFCLDDLLTCATILNQIFYCGVSWWGRLSCSKIGSLTSMSRSLQVLILAKCDYFYLSSKLLACLQQRLVWQYSIISQSVEGQGHREDLMSVNVWMASSETQNILLPNLVWWCSIMRQFHAQKKCLLSSRSRSQQGLIWSK